VVTAVPLILLEAKGFTGWSNTQLLKKAPRIGAIFGQAELIEKAWTCISCWSSNYSGPRRGGLITAGKAMMLLVVSIVNVDGSSCEFPRSEVPCHRSPGASWPSCAAG